MGTIKKIGNKSYTQDEAGDWYEVESPVQAEPLNAKVINGIQYEKDEAGDWYEVGPIEKKNGSQPSEDGGTVGAPPSPSQSQSELPKEKKEEERPKNPITLLLESNRLKKESEQKGQAFVSGGTGGAAVSIIPNKELLNKSIEYKNAVLEMGIDEKTQKQLLDEWSDFPSGAENLTIKRDDGTIDKPYSREALYELRGKDYRAYKSKLDNIKTFFDIKDAAGTSVANEFARSIYSEAGNTLYDKVENYEFAKKRQSEIINKNLPEEKKGKALSRLDDEIAGNVYSTFNTSDKAKEYLTEYLSRNRKALKPITPGAETMFAGDVEYAGDDLGKYSLESIKASIDPNDKIRQEIFKIYKKGIDLSESIQRNPTLDEAAIEYASKQDPKIAAIIENTGGVLPDVYKGEIVYNFLNDPDVMNMAKQNPEIGNRYAQTFNNINVNYPDFAKKNVSAIISQERENRGMNNWFANIPTQESTDKLVNELVKEGKLTEYQQRVYQNLIRGELGILQSVKRGALRVPFGAFVEKSPIATPGVLESTQDSFNESMKGIARSMEDISSIVTPVSVFPNDAQRVYNVLQDNYSNVAIMPKGKLHEVSEATGHLTGFIIPMMVGGAAFGGSKAGHFITNALMFEGVNRDRAELLFPDDPSKRFQYTALTTAGDMMLGELIPQKNVRNQIARKLKGDIKNITNALADGTITNANARKTLLEKAISYVPKLAVENLKTAGTITGFGVFHNMVDSMYGGNDMKIADIAHEAVKSFKTTYLATPLLAMLSLHGKAGDNKTNGKILMELASNPEAYKKIIEEQAKLDPTLNETKQDKLENLGNAAMIKADLDNTSLTEAQKEKYLILALTQKIYERKSTQTSDEAIGQEYFNKAMKAKEEKEKIIKGLDKAEDYEEYSGKEKPLYMIGEKEVDRETFLNYIRSEEAKKEDIELYVENDDEVSMELEKIGGVSEFITDKEFKGVTKEETDKAQTVIDKINNKEAINELELKEAEDVLYTALENNPESSRLIEPLIQKLQEYENVTKTEVVKTIEREPIEGTTAAKRKIEIKPALEQSEGSEAAVTLGDGTRKEGVLRTKEGNYVIETKDGETIVIGEKAITDRDLITPEGEQPVELDENGNVKSVTFETRDGKRVTITDREKALDLGVQLNIEMLGEIPDVAFDRAYREVVVETKTEVPVTERKAKTEAEKAEIKKEETAEKEKEKQEVNNTQEKIKELNDEKFNALKTNAGYGARETVTDERIAKDYHDALKIEESKRTDEQKKIIKAVNETLGIKKRGVVGKKAKGKAASFVAKHIEGTETEPVKQEPAKSGEEILKELENVGAKASDEKSMTSISEKTKEDKKKSKIVTFAQKAAKTLKSVFPGMEIYIHENEADYDKVMSRVNGKKSSGGNFAIVKKADGTYTGRIDINLNKSNNRTVAHEVTHAILFKTFGENQQLFQEYRDKISKILSQSTDSRLRKFADSPIYKKQGVSAEEYLAELSGLMSSKTISPLLLAKIANAINEFVSKITGGKFIPFEDVNNAKDVIEFFDTISKTIKSGKELIIDREAQQKELSKKQIQSKAQTEKLFSSDKEEIEKILGKAGKNEKGKKWKLEDVARVIQDFIDKKKVFKKPVNELTDKEFIDGIKKETEKELTAWENSIGGKEYISFYKTDIIDRTNPKLQQFAEKRYGRKLNPEEISLYHLVSAFASPEATPEFDSSKGLEVFDKYMRTGELTGLSDKQATVWSLNEKGEKVDTGELKYTEEGEPVMAKWSKAYADYSLNKFKKIIDYFNGDLKKAIDWMQTIHSYEEISNMMGTPLKGTKALLTHENLSKENGGFGIFGFTGAKLGSYALNRIGEYSTITKDMWYARTMARLAGEPLVDEKGKAVKRPWDMTQEGVRKRKLADKAWEDVAKRKGLTPSDIQERMWDYEKRLYEKLGAVESASYASDGFMKQAKVFEPDIKFEEPISEEIKSKSQLKEKELTLESKKEEYGRAEKERAVEGIKINSEKVQYNGTNAIGSRTRAESEQIASRNKAKEKIKNPETNASLKAANSYNKSVGLPEVTSHKYKPSDPVLQKQIADIYPKLKDVNSPEYKETELERRIYSEYKNKYPEIFKEYDIKDYKDLVNKSYAQLIKETQLQYESLPVKVTYHEKGEGNYENNFEMLDDVHNFNHLWVYKGGEDHTALGSKTMDKNGLTANDKFRGVHDYFGHSVEGYQFGKDGEENAWIEHSKMFSPLAQWALTSETRGQNSWVNYSGINKVVLETIKTGSALKKEGKRLGNQEMINEGEKLLSTVYDDFQFAEQKAIILPEKYTDISKYHEQKIKSIPEKLKYDKEDIAGVPGEVGVGEKPIEAELVTEAGKEEAPAGGVLQAPGAEGEVKVAEEIKSKAQLSEEQRKVADMKAIIKDYVNEGRDLNYIKEEMQDEFGDYYSDVESIIERAYNEMKTSAIKISVVEREREERGAPAIEIDMKRTFGDVFDTVKEKVAKGEMNGLTIAAEVVKKPRPLSAEESAALLIDRIRISNQYKKKNAELSDAFNEGNAEKIEIIQSQLDVLEQEMDLNDEASRKSGYEQGLGLAIRRQVMADDYSLVNQMNRLKAANEGKEVPKEYKEKLEALVKKLEEESKKLEEVESEEVSSQKQKEISSIKPVKKTTEEVVKEKESIVTKIASKWNKTVSAIKQGLGITGKSQIVSKSAVSPQKQAQLQAIVKDVNDMVKLYAQSGVTKLDDIINNIHRDISQKIQGIDASDIQDIILGVYDVAKTKTPLTPQKIQAQANVKRVKVQIDMLKEELRLKQRGAVEKGVDYLHGWHRFAILSGIPSIAKIGTAALSRGLVTRMENITGQILSIIPGISKIAAKAPREGRLSPKAEAKAFATWFDKMTIKDMGEVMKTGVSEIDYLYGGKEPMAMGVPKWMEFFGRMHGALKLLPKRAEFFRSLEMRTENAIKNGKNVNDPMVQQELATAAYDDALRAIFMQDNPISGKYNELVNDLEQKHPAFASALKFIFPIVKVPTNYVAEQASYVPVVAAVKMLTTLYRGKMNMTPEQADYFMRALKKGSVGVAFIFMGYMNPQMFGGYYTGKRKKEDLEAGDIEIFGKKIPHFMTHTPLLEMLQVGATMRRASDAKMAKGEEPGMLDGIPTVFKGQLTQVPFIGTGERVMKMMDDKTLKGVENFGNSMLKSAIEPQIIQNIADWTDMQEGKVVERKPEGLKETLKEGIPGLRKEVRQDVVKYTDKEYEEFKGISDIGINIPELGKRTRYKVDISQKHPEGLMSQDEFEEFAKLHKKYVISEYKDMYREEKKTIDKIKEIIKSGVNDDADRAKLNKLKEEIQNKIESIHAKATKEAKQKLKLVK